MLEHYYLFSFFLSFLFFRSERFLWVVRCSSAWISAFALLSGSSVLGFFVSLLVLRQFNCKPT